MARTPAQRGRIGTWLVQSRLARGYETQAEARREIERLTGWRIPQSQYAEWESGRRVPSEGSLERLQGFYGAPAEATAPNVEAAAVVAAITRLTEAVERIETRLDGLGGSVDGLADGLLDLLTRFASAQLGSEAASESRHAET